MDENSMYEDWIASRRAVVPPVDLIDQVMESVEKHALPDRWLLLADRMNESQPTRMAACLAGLLVGGLPFCVVAYIACFGQSPLL